MRQEASSLEWLEALSPKWPLPELCKRSCIWSTPTPPCLPGRSETGCCWSGCVTTTACPASAPSTGTDGLMYACACDSTDDGSKHWASSLCLYRIIRNKVQSESCEVGESCLSLLVSLELSVSNVSWHWPLTPGSVISIICCHGNSLSLRVRLFHQWNSGIQEMQQQT